MTRPIIGSQYRPARFETRTSDGTYAAYNTLPGRHAERVQGALLDNKHPYVPDQEYEAQMRRANLWAAIAGGVALAAVAAAMTFASFHGYL